MSPPFLSDFYLEICTIHCGFQGDMRRFARGPFFASTTVKYIERAHSLHHYDSNDSGHFLDVWYTPRIWISPFLMRYGTTYGPP